MSSDLTITVETQPSTQPETAADLATKARELAEQMSTYAVEATQRSSDAIAASMHGGGSSDFLIIGLTVFVLACFVGYYVVWKVTPALHSPLMGITNAISSVIIVGAVLAAGPADGGIAKLFCFLAIVLASINIFGGFIITRRMLSMFKKKGA
jgi:NAD(P) transhydrogenase subunit alpha